MKTLSMIGTLALCVAALAGPAHAVDANCPSGSSQSLKVGDTNLVCGTEDTALSETVYAYRGIPYAEPPQGALRWQPPRAKADWNGSYVQRPDNICHQFVPKSKAPYQSEDCLYLNVWTTVAASDTTTKLPVMVFIHGGAFVLGSGTSPLYDGGHLAATGSKGDVVVVTLNYRLGPLGFMAFNNKNATVDGNLGLRDQQLAMKWVHDHIGDFGGDAGNITIFGESAGAMSVGFHLFSMPSSAPYFKAAIMESNPINLPYQVQADAQTRGRQFIGDSLLRYKKIIKTADNVTLADLQKLPVDVLLKVSTDKKSVFKAQFLNYLLHNGLYGTLPWAPNIDGTLVVNQPLTGFATGKDAVSPKPFMFGTNDREGILFTPKGNSMKGTTFNSLVKVMFGASRLDSITADSVYNHKKVPKINKMTKHAVAFSNIATDYVFTCGNSETAQAAVAQNATVYGYKFKYLGSYTIWDADNAVTKKNKAAADCIGEVCHGAELPFVFTNFVGIKDGGMIEVGGSPTDSLVAATITDAWTSFAYDQVPSIPNQASWDSYNKNGQLLVWSGSSDSTRVSIAMDTKNKVPERAHCDSGKWKWSDVNRLAPAQ